jgi:hypothetical protein
MIALTKKKALDRKLFSETSLTPMMAAAPTNTNATMDLCCYFPCQ